MIKGLGCALLLFATACTTRPPTTAPPSTAGPSSMVAPRSTAELAAAIDSAATRSDNEPDPKIRAELAAQAVITIDRRISCADLALRIVEVARAHMRAAWRRTHAGEILSSMLEDLAHAESADSYYDEAGPARVRALVIRAPGWPLGRATPGGTGCGAPRSRASTAVSAQPVGIGGGAVEERGRQRRPGRLRARSRCRAGAARRGRSRPVAAPG